MNHSRRTWMKRGAIFVPMVFVPKLILAQNIMEAALASQQKPQAASGGGGTGTQWLSTVTPGGSNTTPAFTLGYKFTVGGASITVLSLAIYNNNAANSASHAIGLWDATGATLLASTSVPMSGGVGMKIVSVSSIVLSSSTSYLIGELPGSETYNYTGMGGTGSFTVTGVANTPTAYFGSGASLTAPTSNAGNGTPSMYSLCSFGYQ